MNLNFEGGSTVSISNLIQKWSGINETSKILIIVDDIQKSIADSIKEEEIYEVQIEYFSNNDAFFSLLKSMKSRVIGNIMKLWR